jgi:hypothetical protein
MRWQDLPQASRIEDRTYGPQLPPLPDNELSDSQYQAIMAWKQQQRQRLQPAQQNWLHSNLPAKLPTTPMVGPAQMPSEMKEVSGIYGVDQWPANWGAMPPGWKPWVGTGQDPVTLNMLQPPQFLSSQLFGNQP